MSHPPPPHQPPSQVPYRRQHRRVLPDLYPSSQSILPHEDLESYRAGGFHPVNLGDIFQGGRYTIHHKLGYGGFSTVWLAYDKDTRRWVSIKVKAADVSAGSLDQDQEISIMRQLEKRHAELAPGKPMPCVRLLDCFQHRGPNGTHNCLVTELVGPSISQILECYEYRGQTFQPDTIMRASCQLLDALSLMHQAGFAHGDISKTNVAFMSEFDDDEDLIATLGEPETADYESDQIPWSPDLPKHLVQYTLWPGWYEPALEDLRLIDFGGAFPVDSRVTKIAQPVDLRSPETLFIGSFDYRHDLWRAGCIMFFLFYQKNPFPYAYGGDAFYLLKLVNKFGPLPDNWHGHYEELKKLIPRFEVDERRWGPDLITDSFEPRRQIIISNCEDEESIYNKDEHSEYDSAALSSILHVMIGLLQYRPEHRLSLHEAVSHIRSKWTDYRKEAKLKDLKFEELTLEEANPADRKLEEQKTTESRAGTARTERPESEESETEEPTTQEPK
ncbi:kinase-like protein [Nemania sp. FL0916]|nr:kinase-like protein [Nemania sp. FL0916]